MGNKKYQVFCSSVYSELEAERAALISALFKSGKFFPVAMEHFVAGGHTISELYNYIDQSDIYVLILKKDMGSKYKIDNDILNKLCSEHDKIKDTLTQFLSDGNFKKEDLTFTQWEFIFACACNKPRRIFIYQGEEESGNDARKDRMMHFFGHDNIDHIVDMWKDPRNLITNALAALEKETDRLDPSAGWIRETESPFFISAAMTGIRSIDYKGDVYINVLKGKMALCKTLYIVATTGKNLISNNQDLFADFIARGGNIKILAALPHSHTLKDVCAIESNIGGDRSSIHNENDEILRNLNYIYSSAIKKKNAGIEPGTIQIANSRTLFRSSITICENERNAWGWLTITLPPRKSKDMVSLELEYNPADGKEENKNLLASCLFHISHIWELAEKSNEVWTISESDTELKHIIRKMRKTGKKY